MNSGWLIYFSDKIATNCVMSVELRVSFEGGDLVINWDAKIKILQQNFIENWESFETEECIM